EVIVVVDADSSDATEKIAREWADRVLVRRFDDFASQRNAALEMATCDWILAVDADERIPPKLKQEIQARLCVDACEVVAFRIPIRSTLFGREFRFSGTQLDRPVRLYRRDSGHWVGRVHETVPMKGEVGLLSSYIKHATHERLHEFLRKMNQ